MLSAVPILLSVVAFAQSNVHILDAATFPVVPFFGEDFLPTSGDGAVANKAGSHPVAAQSDTHKMEAPKAPAPKSEAQLAFNKMKTLEGSWEGHMNTTPKAPEVEGMVTKVTFRVVSRRFPRPHAYARHEI